jgi:hypothetical protein
LVARAQSRPVIPVEVLTTRPRTPRPARSAPCSASRCPQAARSARPSAVNDSSATA